MVMTANSSPPSRATRSSPRSAARSRCATARISSSPIVVAERVVDVLEVVEVDVEHRGRRRRRCATSSITASSRSPK